MLSKEQMYNTRNVPRFNHLVYEFCIDEVRSDTNEAVISLRGKEGYIDLKSIFVSLVADDPTEVTFAEAVFSDVGYWLRVRDNKNMQPFLSKWREEAEVVRKSKAFQALVSEVKNDGKNSFSAAKYLIEEPWKGKTKKAVEQKRKTSGQAASKTPKMDLEYVQEFLQ